MPRVIAQISSLYIIQTPAAPTLEASVSVPTAAWRLAKEYLVLRHPLHMLSMTPTNHRHHLRLERCTLGNVGLQPNRTRLSSEIYQDSIWVVLKALYVSSGSMVNALILPLYYNSTLLSYLVLWYRVLSHTTLDNL